MPNVYSSAQLRVLRTLANYTAIALDKAAAYAEVKEKNQQILATQQQLVEAEKMASSNALLPTPLAPKIKMTVG